MNYVKSYREDFYFKEQKFLVKMDNSNIRYVIGYCLG